MQIKIEELRKRDYGKAIQFAIKDIILNLGDKTVPLRCFLYSKTFNE